MLSDRNTEWTKWPQGSQIKEFKFDEKNFYFGACELANLENELNDYEWDIVHKRSCLPKLSLYLPVILKEALEGYNW